MKFKLKKGYGSHRAGGVTYRSGDIIDTTRDALGGAIDKFEAMEADSPPEQPTVGLHIVKVVGGFNVVNGVSGKALNDKPLLKGVATSMLNEATMDEKSTEADDRAADDDQTDGDGGIIEVKASLQSSVDDAEEKLTEANNAFNKVKESGNTNEKKDAAAFLKEAKGVYKVATDALLEFQEELQ